jgi:hypothetical protein
MRLDDPAPTSSEPIVTSFAAEVAAARGKIVGTWSDAGVLTSAETRGVRHVFGWSPTSAEHHLRVGFSVPSSAILRRGGWSSPDAAFASWLDAQVPAIRGFLAWERLDWGVQVRAIGGVSGGVGDGGHLVVAVGDYAGRSGLTEALEVVEALAHVLPRAAHAAGPLLAPAEFTGRACRALGIGFSSR